MAHLLQKNYGLLRQEFNFKDILRYISIALVALLGIAGILQSISGATPAQYEHRQNNYSSGVYTK